MFFNEHTGEFFVPPLQRELSWSLAPDGTLAVKDSVDYVITFYASDGTPLRKLQVERQRSRVTAEERRQYLDDWPWGEGTETVQPRQLRLLEAALDSLLERTLWPAVDLIIYDEVGRLWVRRDPRYEPMAVWDVFDSSLAFAGSVMLPSRAEVLAIRDSKLYAREVDDLGVEYLVRYRAIQLSR